MASALARLLVRNRSWLGSNSALSWPTARGDWSGGRGALSFCSTSTMAPTTTTQRKEEERTWDDVLRLLSGLITFKTRADGKGWRDAFENMPLYMERMGLSVADLERLSVVHVAGTKGKGSTCAMVEAALRASGYRTALFTSPHLCDVRERVRVDGRMVSREVFAEHCWAAHDALAATASEDGPGMPGYFRFLTLLGLRLALASHVDVLVLEVGIGGRLDATNVVPRPAVCGVTALGFDHTELLGDTLGAIAKEKAGIFKPGVLALTTPQPEEAMAALRAAAAAADAPLSVPPPLSAYAGAPAALGLRGAHQEENAALAVALAGAWEEAQVVAAASGGGGDAAKISGDADALGLAGAAARVEQLKRQPQRVLPATYAAGLASVKWPGRSQVVHDNTSGAPLTFFLDGAHTPESMGTCAAWFADAHAAEEEAAATSAQRAGAVARCVLVFNCTRERDPAALLPRLRAALAAAGVPPAYALFVPPDSQYAFLAVSGGKDSDSKDVGGGKADQQQPPVVDVSWQLELRGAWQAAAETVTADASTAPPPPPLPVPLPQLLPGAPPPQDSRHGAVLPSVAAALTWLRANAAALPPSQRLHVLVTGSLYLVGDTLAALGAAPE